MDAPGRDGRSGSRLTRIWKAPVVFAPSSPLGVVDLPILYSIRQVVLTDAASCRLADGRHFTESSAEQNQDAPDHQHQGSLQGEDGRWC